jgi:DNA invertase Pin-like site-specific DNA recombinase
MTRTVAYIRVSTGKQDSTMQLEAIKGRLGGKADLEVVPETESGSKHLEKLNTLIEELKAGDTLAVYAIDRLGRKLSNVIRLIEKLNEKKIALISVREGVDCSTPVGRMVVAIMGSVAEMEREMIIERTKNALKTRKDAGYLTHRPWKFDEETRVRVCALRKAGYTFRQIRDETGVSLGGIRYLLEAESRTEQPKRKSEVAA